MTPGASKTASVTWRSVPTTVWTLGFVSLLMDVSSELIHSLLPVFLTTVIGASTVTVGLIEGIAEATAAIAKVFSGALSDRIGKRKLLVGFGYGLAAVTKPVFPLASTAWEVLAARFVDRIGKGIRDAPRDALIADITPPTIRGASYGIRQALDRRLCRAAACRRPDGALCRRLSRRVLVGAGARGACGAVDRRRRSRA
jgi:MFS family permease